MPKKLHDFTAQESVAPYIKAVAATGNAQDACRAVHLKVADASVTLTVNGEDVAFWLLRGHIYPICATKSSSTDVVFLY